MSRPSAPLAVQPPSSLGSVTKSEASLSPTSVAWSNASSKTPLSPDAQKPFNFFDLPPSPPTSTSSCEPASPLNETSALLRQAAIADSTSMQPDLCISTEQIFDCMDSSEPPLTPSTSASPSPTNTSSSPRTAPANAMKRSCSPTPVPTKKPRVSHERVSTKDFVHPDVTGLSKREARLVKNRAAAFLSRQRKREEFENMEARVTELEKENARLHALARANEGAVDTSTSQLLAEVQHLRARLRAAEARESELLGELERRLTGKSPRCSSRSMGVQASGSHYSNIGVQVPMRSLPSLLQLPTGSANFTGELVDTPGSAQFPPEYQLYAYGSNGLNWSRDAAEKSLTESGDRTFGAAAFPARTLEAPKMEYDALTRNIDLSFDKNSMDLKLRARSQTMPSGSSSTASSSAPASAAVTGSFLTYGAKIDDAPPSWDETSFRSHFDTGCTPAGESYPQSSPPPYLGSSSPADDRLTSYLGGAFSHRDFSFSAAAPPYNGIRNSLPTLPLSSSSPISPPSSEAHRRRMQTELKQLAAQHEQWKVHMR